MRRLGTKIWRWRKGGVEIREALLHTRVYLEIYVLGQTVQDIPSHILHKRYNYPNYLDPPLIFMMRQEKSRYFLELLSIAYPRTSHLGELIWPYSSSKATLRVSFPELCLK